MKVTINFEDEELESALQHHLNTGFPIQTYIKSALRYFNVMLAHEEKGNACGYGDKSRFKTYNTVESPKDYL